MKKSIIRECVRIAQAKYSMHPRKGNGFIHFSFVIEKNKLLEMGTNRQIKMPKHYGYNEYSPRHAEIDAWRKARGIVKGDGWELVNIRVNNLGELRNSRPCAHCYNMLKAFGCKVAWFSTDDGIKKMPIN